MPFLKKTLLQFRQAPKILQWLIGLIVIQLELELLDLLEAIQYSGKRALAQAVLWALGILFRLLLVEGLINRTKGVRVVMLLWSAIVYVWFVHDLPTLPHNFFNHFEDNMNFTHACFSIFVSAFAVMVMLRPGVKQYLKSKK